MSGSRRRRTERPRPRGRPGSGSEEWSRASRSARSDGAEDAVPPGSGRPLPDAARRRMERSLGEGFGDVRIHTGPEAARSAREAGANAYTVGSDVVFGAGRFDPSTRDGRGLLAHELTHVVQQRRSGPRFQADPEDGGRGGTGAAERAAEEAAEAAAGRAPAPPSVTVLVTDPDQFVRRVGQLIEAVAGAEGTELEINAILRFPVYRALFATGSVQMKVAHDEDGFRVQARPALGVSAGRVSRQGHGFVDLLADFSIEARGRTGVRAMEMVSLALEAEVRALDREPPPLLVSAILPGLLPPGAGPALLGLEAGWRLAREILGEDAVPRIWSYLADGIWGEGHMEQVMAGMEEGEYTQTLDEGALTGEASGGEGVTGTVSVRIGLAQRRRIDVPGGGDGGRQREDLLFAMKGTVGFEADRQGIGPGTGEMELKVPLTGDIGGGSLSFKVGFMARASYLGGPLSHYAVSTLADLIRIALREIQEYRQQEQDDESLRRAQRELRRQLDGDLAGLVGNAAWSTLASLPMARVGIEVEVKLDLATSRWSVDLFVVESLTESAAGSGVGVTRKRRINPAAPAEEEE